MEYSDTKTASGARYPKTRIGELLKNWRVDRKMTQREVASKHLEAFPQLQVDISTIETHKNIANDNQLKAIANLTGKKISELKKLRDEDEKERFIWRNKRKSAGRRKSIKGRQKKVNTQKSKLNQLDIAFEKANQEQEQNPVINVPAPQNIENNTIVQLATIVPPPSDPKELPAWLKALGEFLAFAK